MVSRKSIAVLTAFLMLVSNTGFALTVHYCGGKMASVSSGFEITQTLKAKAEKSCCAKKVATSHKKCCSDKTVHFKAKTGDIIAKFTAQIAWPFFAAAVETPVFEAVRPVKTEKFPSYYCDAHAPPLFKLYHRYLLYA